MNVSLDGKELSPASIVICIQFDEATPVNMHIGYVLDEMFKDDFEGIAEAFTPKLKAAMIEFAQNYNERKQP